MMDAEEVKLGSLDALEIKRGIPTFRTSKSGEVAVFSVAGLRNGDAPQRFVTRDEMRMSKVDLAEVGDVLVSIEGGTVGECFVVHKGLDDFVPSQQVATLRTKAPSRLNSWYLAAWLSSDDGQRRLGTLIRGAGIQRIALNDLRTLDVLIPGIADQNRLGERYRVFTESIRGHRSIATDLEVLQKIEFALANSGYQPSKSKSERLKRIPEDLPKRLKMRRPVPIRRNGEDTK